MSWQKVKLGVLCGKIGSGATPKGGAQVYINTGVALIRSQNVYNGFFKYEGLTHISDDAACKLRGVTVESRDVLLNITGDSVARCSMVPDSVLPARVNQHVAILRTRKELLIPEYLQVALTTEEMQAFMIGLASSQGGSRNAITKANIEDFEISLPPLPIQRKIADVLGAYDELIENNRKRIALLEKMARELYRERFVRRKVKMGNTVRLGDVCTCLLGGTPSRSKPDFWNGDVPWINSGKINELRIVEPSEYITDAGLKHSATKLLPRKTTVLAITGATLGQVSLLEIESAANQSVIGVVENDRLPYTFIYPMICESIADLIALQTGGAQQHINKDNLESMGFYLPDEAAIGSYHAVAAPMYDEMAVLLLGNISLAKQRDRLLPRLMSGKIDVEKLVKEGK